MRWRRRNGVVPVVLDAGGALAIEMVATAPSPLSNLPLPPPSPSPTILSSPILCGCCTPSLLTSRQGGSVSPITAENQIRCIAEALGAMSGAGTVVAWCSAAFSLDANLPRVIQTTLRKKAEKGIQDVPNHRKFAGGYEVFLPGELMSRFSDVFSSGTSIGTTSMNAAADIKWNPADDIRGSLLPSWSEVAALEPDGCRQQRLNTTMS